MTAEPIAVPWRRAKRRLTDEGYIERWCNGCQDWWPDEAEFWYRWGQPKQHCRACQNAASRKAHQRKRHPETDDRRIVMGPAICQHCREYVWLKPHPDRRKKRAYVWEHAA